MPTETEIEAVAKELFFCDHDGEWDDADGDTTEICRLNARAAIAALDAVRGDGWMPIESAPKDGTTIVAYDWVVGASITVVATGDDKWPWRILMGDREFTATCFSHWRHLPLPPKEGK